MQSKLDYSVIDRIIHFSGALFNTIETKIQYVYNWIIRDEPVHKLRPRPPRPPAQSLPPPPPPLVVDLTYGKEELLPFLKKELSQIIKEIENKKNIELQYLNKNDTVGIGYRNRSKGRYCAFIECLKILYKYTSNN